MMLVPDASAGASCAATTSRFMQDQAAGRRIGVKESLAQFDEVGGLQRRDRQTRSDCRRRLRLPHFRRRRLVNLGLENIRFEHIHVVGVPGIGGQVRRVAPKAADSQGLRSAPAAAAPRPARLG